MANPQRGEYPLTVGDRTLTLVLDFEAMVQVEDVMSTPDRVVSAHEVFWQIFGRKFPPFKHARAALYAALKRKQPEITLAQTGELIEEMGGTECVTEALLGVYKAAQPDKEDREGRPRAARQPLTGEPTTSTPDASGSKKKRSGA